MQKIAEEVSVEEISSPEIQEVIDLMFAIAKGEREDVEKKVMVGLAAPQIGIMKQIIIVDMAVDASRRYLGELEVFINPKIIWKSEEQELGREGCFSVDAHLCGIVARATKIRMQAWDLHGQRIERELSGFTARIFQHEVDHLHGIRFPDRVGEKGVLHWVESDQYPEYRSHWQQWSAICPWDTWLAMKEGRSFCPPNKS